MRRGISVLKGKFVLLNQESDEWKKKEKVKKKKKQRKKKRKVEKEENEWKKNVCNKTRSTKNQIEMSLGEF